MRTHLRRDGRHLCLASMERLVDFADIELLLCALLNPQFTGDPFLTRCIKLALYAGMFVLVITFLFSHQNQGRQTRLVHESKEALDLFGRWFRSFRRDHQGGRRLLQKQRAHLGHVNMFSCTPVILRTATSNTAVSSNKINCQN
jgi:hypothetical protein